MTRIESRGIFSRTARGLLMIGAILTLAASPRSTVAQQKAEAKPQEKKAEAKPQPTQTPADDPGKLKAQLTALQQEVAQLKVATLELEKLGASVNVDKGKDGKEIATVNILGQWSLALHSPHRPLTRAAESRDSVSLFRTAPKDR